MTNYIENNREIFSNEIEVARTNETFSGEIIRTNETFSGEIIRSAEIIKAITQLESCYAVDSGGVYAQDIINERAKGWQIFN